MAVPVDPVPPAIDRRRAWRRHLGVAFGMGSLAALAATIAYAVVLVPLLLAGGPDALAGILLPFGMFVGPLVEEAAKLGLVLAWGARRRPGYAPEGWMALGAVAGLGFGSFENVTYWLQFATQSLPFANAVFLVRFFTGLPVHALATALTTYGFVLAAARRRLFPGVVALAAGVGVHVFWNSWLFLNALGVFP